MPLKINVGLSRKVGEQHYSSRGGSVHLEAEVEATLVRDPEQLQKRIRYLFRLAEESLTEQLSDAATSSDATQVNGHVERRPATERQLALIGRLAESSEISLEALLTEGFETDACEHLSVSEASRLIDILQAERASKANADNGRF